MEPETNDKPAEPIAASGASAAVVASQPATPQSYQRSSSTKQYVTPEETASNNKMLQDAYRLYVHKKVRISKTGQIGTVVGVDPRPQAIGAKQDGVYLIIRVPKDVLPGRHPAENAYSTPEGIEVLDETTTS